MGDEEDVICAPDEVQVEGPHSFLKSRDKRGLREDVRSLLLVLPKLHAPAVREDGDATRKANFAGGVGSSSGPEVDDQETDEGEREQPAPLGGADHDKSMPAPSLTLAAGTLRQCHRCRSNPLESSRRRSDCRVVRCLRVGNVASRRTLQAEPQPS